MKKKIELKKFSFFFRILTIRNDKIAVFCDIIDVALTVFTSKEVFFSKIFEFFKNEIVFDFSKFDEFDQTINYFEIFFWKVSNFKFEKIKIFDWKQNESIFFICYCKSLMNLNDVTNFFRKNENLKKIFEIFEFSFFTYCNIFLVSIEIIIETIKKIEKTNCRFCCFETILIAFFHKRFEMNKK